MSQDDTKSRPSGFGITVEKAEVYVIVGNVVSKFILSVATAAVFLVLGIALAINPVWPIALVEVFLSGTIFLVFRHYFPSTRSKK